MCIELHTTCLQLIRFSISSKLHQHLTAVALDLLKRVARGRCAAVECAAIKILSGDGLATSAFALEVHGL
jgi:hypothetical protein